MKTTLPRKFTRFIPLILSAVIIGGIGAYFVFFGHAETSNNIYRLVNANGAHIISTDTNEKNNFVSNGWNLELTRTYAAVTASGTTPMSRMHNSTYKVWAVTDPAGTANLLSNGWTNQGVKFNSVKGYNANAPYGFCRVAWYRLLKDRDRFYTPDANEANRYVSQRGYTLDSSDAFELFTTCSTNPEPQTPTDPPGNGGGNGGGTGGGTTTPPKTPTTKTPTKTTPAPTAPSVSTTADATVTAGTRSAKLSIPAGGAQSVKVIYGTAADKLDKTSDVQTVSGSDNTITLKGLDPQTTYSYQVVRTTGSQTKSSATATFKTTGYDLVLNFVNGDQSPVADITGKIQNPEQEATSNEEGVMRFSDVPAGSYSVEYSYNDKTYTEALNTANPTNVDETDNAGVLSASNTIDVSTLGKDTTQAQPKKKSKLPLILALLLLLGLIAGVVVFILRRRAAKSDDGLGYITPPIPPAPTPTAPAKPSDPNLHVGESLRDMVIKSMHEEAARRNHTKPPEDPPAK